MGRAYLRSSARRLLSRRDLLAILVAVVAGVALYLLLAARTYRTGFPLDDSWIHQSFARTLAQNGEWAFRPGFSSEGSTSPLWSLLLSFGYLLGVAPYGWTYLLGALALFGLATITEWAVRQQIPTFRPQLPWAGIFIAFEWHLLWAAVSGMETALHAMVSAATLVLLIAGSRHYTLMGLLTGLSLWVRPDGITLAGPVLLSIALVEKGSAGRWKSALAYGAPLGLLMTAYLAFHLAVGDMPMPSTFYAKQAEYGVWQAMPWSTRLGQMAVQLFAGPGAVLLPGVVLATYGAAKRRDWPTLSVAAWMVGYVVIYVSRLPVYQHARYLMPTMPAFHLLGLLGLIDYVRNRRGHWQRLTGLAWTASLAMLWFVFIGLGARSYATDVAVIESEMVRTAAWTSANLPADALLAAHDIGALGYFDRHSLIDLAGLVSPETTSFLRNEQRLKTYLDERGADYLIAFPGFYPNLTAELEVAYETGSPFSRQMGHENLTVYRWDTAN